MGGWVGGVEELRIKPSQLSTKLKLKLKLKLSLAILHIPVDCAFSIYQITVMQSFLGPFWEQIV